MPSLPQPPPSPLSPSTWIPQFRSLTPRTRVVRIPSPLVEALIANTYSHPTAPFDQEWSDGTPLTAAAQPSPPSFPEFNSQLEAVIAELGGAVSPKLKRMSPIDAVWVNFDRSTKCTCADDVLMLLASSERVLGQFEGGEGLGEDDGMLILRQWADMNTLWEFRCYIRGGVLVGMQPRHEGGRYSESEMDEMVGLVSEWHEDKVRERIDVRRYVMDVYVEGKERVWLVDFGEWGVGGAGLFRWRELGQARWMREAGRAQFRCSSGGGIRPGRGMTDGLPVELRGAGAVQRVVEAAERLTRAETGEAGE